MRYLTLTAIALMMPAIAAAQSVDTQALFSPARPGSGNAALSKPAIDEVELVSPAEGAVIYEGTLRLVWHPVTFASQYEIQFSHDAFATIAGVLGSLDTVLGVSMLAEEGRYWWRVRAVGFEDQGPFSEARSFQYRHLSAVPVVAAATAATAVTVAPNPALSATTISFHLDRADEVAVDLLDDLGRSLRSIPAGHREAGDHAIDLDLSGLAAGHYLYRLATSTGVVTGTLVVL